MGARGIQPIDLATYLGEPITVTETSSPGQLVFTVPDPATGGAWLELSIEAWHNIPDALDHWLAIVVKNPDTGDTHEIRRTYTPDNNFLVHISNWRLRRPLEIYAYADTASIMFLKPEWDLRAT